MEELSNKKTIAIFRKAQIAIHIAMEAAAKNPTAKKYSDRLVLKTAHEDISKTLLELTDGQWK